MRLTPYQISIACDMRARGYKLQQIADLLGCSISTVCNRTFHVPAGRKWGTHTGIVPCKYCGAEIETGSAGRTVCDAPACRRRLCHDRAEAGILQHQRNRAAGILSRKRNLKHK